MKTIMEKGIFLVTRIVFIALLAASTRAYGDWTYDSGRITEVVAEGATPWIFNCTLGDNGVDLKVNSLNQKGDNSILDLNAPVADGYKIRAIAESTNLFKQRAAGFADAIILPATLTSVPAWSMEACKNPIIIPPDNEIVTLGTGCFTRSYLTGDVVLPKVTTMSGGDNQGPFNSCTRLTSLDLGPDITGTASYGNLAKNCSGLTNLVIRASTFTISSWSMQGCTAMRNWTFYCYPTLQGSWAAGVTFGKRHRIFMSLKHGAWSDVVVSSSFTPWADADQDSYWTNFGADAPEPIGYTTTPFAAYLVPLADESDAGATVLVEGSPERYSVVSPDYGEHTEITDPVTFTAPQYLTKDDVLYECYGYFTSRWDEAGLSWSDGPSVSELSFDFEPEGNETVKITWLWREAGFAVKSFGILDGCAIVTNSIDLVEGFVRKDSVVSFTATGENFTEWYNLPPNAVVDGAAISFSVSAPVSLYAYYNWPWTYDAAAGTINDRYWTMRVTADGEDLSLQSVAVALNGSRLDLNKEITGGYKIRTIAASYNLFKGRAAGFAYEIILPSTLTSVKGWSMEQCKNPITIPPDNEIVVLGAGCFNSSYLTGDVVLPKVTTMSGGDNQGPFHSCTRLTSLDLGPDITGTASYGNLAKYCSGLTNLVIRASSFTISSWSMQGCTAMRNWTFYCYPTLQGSWATGVTFGKRHRIFMDPKHSQWSEVIASGSFTPWAEADQATYWANFGAGAPRPIGYTTTPFAAYLVPIRRNALLIMIR